MSDGTGLKIREFDTFEGGYRWELLDANDEQLLIAPSLGDIETFLEQRQESPPEEATFLITQTETFRVPATSADAAIEKLEGMDADEQNRHYCETTNRYAEEI